MRYRQVIGPVSDEEIKHIAKLLREGINRRKIAEMTGRSDSTIGRVRKQLGYQAEKREPRTHQPEKGSGKSFQQLCEMWHWKIPDRKQKKRKNKRSNFITPYHYPRMWGKEE